jgi:uncharacterized membrane protein YfbV (UPF0208 family)
MNMSVFEIIKLGQKYLKSWPEKPELIHYFSDYRAVQSCRFVCRYFPVLAVLTFVLQLYLGSWQALPQAMVYGVFLLSMPIQAYIILGVKADKFLPQSLANWYREGVAKVNEQGGNIKLSIYKPRYIDLAQLLQLTYTK